uniref:hypothetical protein n=1 Tax=Vibrio vulnificus TaxID=672 RepID=UPI0035C7B10B
MTQNQWLVAFFSLSHTVWGFSASWHRWTLLSGHLFFGAKNSESCLSQFSGKREVRVAGTIRNLILGF